MDCIPDGNRGPSAGRRSLSRVSTATSTTLAIHTPASSDADSTSPDDARPPMPPANPSGPLRVTSRSVTDWRPQYPRIGQFAMTPSEEVVAATPNGLVYFMRVQDHLSKPWSEPRPFPQTTATLDASSVTGLALHQTSNQAGGVLNVYCVAAGRLHAFSRSKDSGFSFAVNPRPPFEGSTVRGTPAVASIKRLQEDPGYCIFVPCPSGGILYTSHVRSPGYKSYDRPTWEPATQLATHLSIVSAVSVVSEAVINSGSNSMFPAFTIEVIAVCIAGSRLHSIEGPFEKSSHSSKPTWKGPKSIRIQHPGEVTGNPVLLAHQPNRAGGYQLDLLVPSAEGGIFHFIRTAKTPDEWHMIGRISFPIGVPIASSLASWRVPPYQYRTVAMIRAFVQCGGRLYLIETAEMAEPWHGSQLHPLNGPGPFPH